VGEWKVELFLSGRVESKDGFDSEENRVCKDWQRVAVGIPFKCRRRGFDCGDVILK